MSSGSFFRRPAPSDEFAAIHDDVSGLQPRGQANDGAAEWAADQRFVHGLLRAMHTADAQASSARIDAIMTRIEVEPRIRHRWALVAAAALLLCAVSWPLLMVQRLPEAEAAVLRGAALLADGGDRRFAVESASVDGDGAVQRFELVARPGMHFVVSGPLTMGTIHFADMKFGCDGKEFWFHSRSDAGGGDEVRRHGPLDEAPALLRGIGNVLDLGLLDVHQVVQQLPRDFTLRAEGRVTDETGRSLVHVAATGGPQRQGFCLHRADLWCDEGTGRIVRLEVEADDGLGRLQRLSFRDQGVVAVESSTYDRPW